MKSFHLLIFFVLVGVSQLAASTIGSSHNEKQQFTFESNREITKEFLAIDADNSSSTVHLYNLSFEQPVVIINYLGTGCTHCVAQLNEFKKHSEKFQKLNARIVAISPDSKEKSQNFFSKKDFNQELFISSSDPNWEYATKLGLVATANNEQTLLHGVQVIYKGKLIFGVKGEAPFMGVSTVLDHILNVVHIEQKTVASPTDISKWNVTTVLRESDGLIRPVDVEFNSSLFFENDLWVVNSANNGHHTITIAHDVDKPTRSIVQKADSRRSHFMWRTQALAFGVNGTFATAQNGQNGSFLGNDYSEYLFMGPTLWSSDTAIFASRNQKSNVYLGSHLDMLHQSPYNLGIAHDTASKYWVSDARYNDISSYDFQNPHEVGGTDHRDGIIYRYKDVTLTPGVYGIPAHIVKDKTSNWLYFIDGGAKLVKRLDITSGTEGETLEMPNFSGELVQSFKSKLGGTVETVVPTDTATPVGIDCKDGILYVSYYETGDIKLFDINNGFAPIETINTKSPGIMGITVNRLGDIWAANHDSSSIIKISRKEGIGLTLSNDVVKVKLNESTTLAFTLKNNKSTVDTVTLSVSGNKINKDWDVFVIEELIIPSNEEVVRNIRINTFETSDLITYTLTASSKDKQRNANASFQVVSSDAERYYVNDAPMETFEVQQQLKEIGKENYIEISSSMFTQNFKNFQNLKTVVWNSATFGDINAIEKAAINDLIFNNVEIMLIADDPILTMHYDEGNSSFLTSFGAKFADFDTTTVSEVKRTYTIDPASEVLTFDAISEAEVNLFPLYHNKSNAFLEVSPGVVVSSNRGYIPTPLFSTTAPWAKPLLKEKTTTLATAVYGDRQNIRTILFGSNFQSFVDENLRNEILNKCIVWLEGASAPTSVQDVTSQSTIVSLLQNPLPDITSIRITPQKELASVKIRLYNSTGALVANIGEYQRINSEQMIPFSSRNLANGVYYIVTEWNGGSTLTVAVKQQ
jgi:peroxiredoxin